MPKFSSAYSALTRRLDEIDSILSLAFITSRMAPIPPNPARVNALCRGGIVLLCSHIEGYVEDLGTLAITRIAEKHIPKASLSPAFKYHLSRDLIDDINGTNEPEAVAARVHTFLSRDGHIWDNNACNFAPSLPVDTFIGNFATPKHANIRKFFGRFGYQHFHGELAAQLRRDFLPCINMVDHVVDQRNKIAHGDFLADGTPSELQQMGSLVRLYCRNIDRVVGNWFKSKGCPIR